MSTITPKFMSVKIARKVSRVYELRTFDVWGNARVGFEVNDSFSQGEISIPCEAYLHNVPIDPTDKDTSRIFVDYNPSDRAISKALGYGPIDIDGDDLHIEVNKRSNGKPLATLIFLRYEY